MVLKFKKTSLDKIHKTVEVEKLEKEIENLPTMFANSFIKYYTFHDVKEKVINLNGTENLRIHWYSESITVSNYKNSVSAMVITSDGYREDTKLKLEKNKENIEVITKHVWNLLRSIYVNSIHVDIELMELTDKFTNLNHNLICEIKRKQKNVNKIKWSIKVEDIITGKTYKRLISQPSDISKKDLFFKLICCYNFEKMCEVL